MGWIIIFFVIFIIIIIIFMYLGHAKIKSGKE
jgi:hypothetical protein